MRERQLIDSVASIAESLVEGHDAVDILQSLVEACQILEGVDQAAIMLLDDGGDLDVVASTSEQSRLIDLLQISASAGPCVECVRTGRPVAVSDVENLPARWSAFQSEARVHGFRSVCALPLRIRDEIIGSLNLFRTRAGYIEAGFVRAAQALADIASVSVVTERSLREATEISRQLQAALDSRVQIEQAKGVLAHTHRIEMEQAFTLLRRHARAHSEPIAAVARRVVARELAIDPD